MMFWLVNSYGGLVLVSEVNRSLYSGWIVCSWILHQAIVKENQSFIIQLILFLIIPVWS